MGVDVDVDVDVDVSVCAICLEPPTDPVVNDTCGHRVCTECMSALLQSQTTPVCPFGKCLAPIRQSDAMKRKPRRLQKRALAGGSVGS